jgi:hypothetical protein
METTALIYNSGVYLGGQKKITIKASFKKAFEFGTSQY